ncbi:DNA translocase FtsK [hydrothermal vent metagenome]|uniref:DNA translocase FtsK n=1 Tax=hydrothermal vent metagenome TaxID=652676 RepID=A0A3B0RU83_9ZZZZ
MARTAPVETDEGTVPKSVRVFFINRMLEAFGLVLLGVLLVLTVALATWSANDPSWNNAVSSAPSNLLGYPGAVVSDQLIQYFGLAVLLVIAIPIVWAMGLFSHQVTKKPFKRGLFFILAIVMLASVLSLLPNPSSWVLGSGLGGAVGDTIAGALVTTLSYGLKGILSQIIAFVLFVAGTGFAIRGATGIMNDRLMAISSPFDGRVSDVFFAAFGAISHLAMRLSAKLQRRQEGSQVRKSIVRVPEGYHSQEPDGPAPEKSFLQSVTGFASNLLGPVLGRKSYRVEPVFERSYGNPNGDTMVEPFDSEFDTEFEMDETAAPVTSARISPRAKPIKQGRKVRLDAQPDLPLAAEHKYELPPLTLLAEPPVNREPVQSADALEQNARLLEGVLEDFGVRGEIINVRPGPVVTLYELEPAPGIKSSRVIGLADDIARSMSAISARVAVVPGRNAIGIELPNSDRETVFLRELLASQAYEKTKQHLAVALGKDIGGEPILADLSRMPHLLIAGTTGSGKSVGINTMILSLLYRLTPDQCKLIMIDPKMLELSVYEGIPHLLSPVVTDPKKAVVALKWAVREMEDRYRKMSKLGVRNIDGFNKRAKQALKKGEVVTRTVQTGYDPETREPIFEEEALELDHLPFIVVIIDEMADLMLVAGKEIEGAVQRLAQMARAAGIHVVMATQRPSVDVITGTIKANFPTRISFQVTSKIDSRTILGEQGAENLLGQGDMLYMAGGGRIIRLHGAFASDKEVEDVVAHLKLQATPCYLDEVTEEPADDPYVLPGMEDTGSESGDDLYDNAVAVVLRDKKASTSYIQRRLQIGYNRAASLIERMEEEGLISSAGQGGKRNILVGDSDQVSH